MWNLENSVFDTGNREAVPVPEVGAKDISAQVAFALSHGVDYAVVAPDDPLALGAVDALTAAGIPCFGPDARAAVIESSKAFAKDLMKKYGIPTARYETFSDPESACAYLETKDTVVWYLNEKALETRQQLLRCFGVSSCCLSTPNGTLHAQES